MRTVLVGAVETSEVALAAMLRAGRPPVAVFTLPLAKAGRHSDFVDLRAPAAAAGIAVHETANVNAPETRDALRMVAPDVVFVIGWSQICRLEFLALPRLGCIGYHPALLPRNRGRAVIPWTILLGEQETASTLFWMDEGTDSGDILAQRCFAVAPDETARSLYDKHLAELRELMCFALDVLADPAPPRVPQDHSRATYCARRTEDDGLIDWQKGAHEVWTLIRAVGDPYPGAFSYLRGERLRILAAGLVPEAPYVGLAGQVQRLDDEGALVRCGDGRFVLLNSVGLDGRAPLAPREVMRMHEKLGLDWLMLHRRLQTQIAEGGTG